MVHFTNTDNPVDFPKDPKDESHLPVSEQSLVFRLRMRAKIRRQIPGRKSLEEGKPDRIADLLDEAADEIERLHNCLDNKSGIRYLLCYFLVRYCLVYTSNKREIMNVEWK
jgi:hypothetical protein